MKSKIADAGESRKTVIVRLAGSSTYEELVALTLANATNGQPGGRNLSILRIQAGTGPDLTGIGPRALESSILDFDPTTHFVLAYGPGTSLRVDAFRLDGRSVFQVRQELGGQRESIAMPIHSMGKETFLLRTTLDGHQQSRRIVVF